MILFSTLLRVWTCFEYCMLKSPDLMRDRHVDQIIMCCTYILAKVSPGCDILEREGRKVRERER